MSSVQRMLVRGIRSFSPYEGDDEGKSQLIEFSKPLTIIVGPNGTGKTTVIEALRYACTGEIPPGAKGSFVHDPKVSGEAEIKAQVKLQFLDVRGNKAVVSRSIQATQKGKKLETKTLDSAIRRWLVGKDGYKRESSISSKCADMDKIMIECLGVSSAVLSNVIFCHQEDSAWPLSESKTLKVKFDDIFDATKYNKALDNIRKVKKDMDSEIKVTDTQLQFLKENTEIAARKRVELDREKAKLAKNEEKVQKLKSQLEPIRARLQELEARRQELYAVNQQIDTIKMQKQLKLNVMRELEATIGTPFEGLTEQLEDESNHFEKVVKQKEAALNQLNEKLADARQSSDALNLEQSKLLQEVGKLQSRVQQYEEKKEHRIKLIIAQAKELNISGYDRNVSDAVVKRFDDELRRRQKVTDEKMTADRDKFDEEERTAQEAIEAILTKKAGLEQTAKANESRQKECAEEIKEINRKLRIAEASQSKMSSVEADLQRAERELSDKENRMNVKENKAKIQKLRQDKEQKDSELRQLQQEMRTAQMQSTRLTQLEMWRKEQIEKECDRKRLLGIHEDNFLSLFDKIPEENFRRQVDDYLNQHSREIRQYETQVSDGRLKIQAKEQERQQANVLLEQKEKEIAEFNKKLEKLPLTNDSIEDTLQSLDDSISVEQLELGHIDGAKFLLDKYLQLMKSKDCCPLCERAFTTKRELEKLVREIEGRIATTPRKIEEHKENIGQLQVQHRELVQLQPQDALIKRYKNEEIPTIKASVKRLQEEVVKLKGGLTQSETKLRDLKAKDDCAKSLQSDAGILDNLTATLAELHEKICDEECNIVDSSGSKSLEELSTAVDNCQQEVNYLDKEKDSLSNQVQEHENLLNALKSKVTGLREEKLNLAKDKQERELHKARIGTLQTDIQRAKDAVSDAQAAIAPLDDEIGDLRRQKADVQERRETNQREHRQQLDRLRQTAKVLCDLEADLQKLKAEGSETVLRDSKAKLDDIQKQLRDVEENQRGLSERAGQLQKDVNQQETRSRCLKDNLKLRQYQKEMTQLDREQRAHEEKRGTFKVESLERDRQDLVEKESTANSDLNTLNGICGVMNDNIRKAERELNTEPLRNVDEKYRQKFVDWKTTDVARQDLLKFYEALDHCIMQFHASKMQEINANIRQLWQDVYRGSDIDYIEIKADEDQGTTENRRTYNYRVVLHNHGTELDMRGRCSAGQKVLASLIIRIALAETFCTNCGILALDEPTTNLDKENIESLAQALIRLIQDRSAQRNFQLIIITHDAEFVEHFLRNHMAEKYYKVSKDENGYSRLTSLDAGELR